MDLFVSYDAALVTPKDANDATATKTAGANMSSRDSFLAEDESATEWEGSSSPMPGNAERKSNSDPSHGLNWQHEPLSPGPVEGPMPKEPARQWVNNRTDPLTGLGQGLFAGFEFVKGGANKVVRSVKNFKCHQYFCVLHASNGVSGIRRSPASPASAKPHRINLASKH